MSNSAILKSSIAKKWWMALTGLFLCLFLVGHLIGNLQLILIHGVEGKRAFNEYAYFMTHNPFIKVLSYVTYFSILFHAIDGLALTIKNKQARPKGYAYNKQGASTALPSRYMAVLGSAILIFIVIHMASFWGKMHYTTMPLHTENFYQPAMTSSGLVRDTAYRVYYLTDGSTAPVDKFTIKNNTELYQGSDDIKERILQVDPTYESTGDNPKFGEGYKDLHSLVMSYFGHDKTEDANLPPNEYALIAVIIYVFAMFVLAFHLWHGFASSFQTLGINHKKYNPLIKGFGKAFAVLIPLAFAIIPVLLFLNK